MKIVNKENERTITEGKLDLSKVMQLPPDERELIYLSIISDILGMSLGTCAEIIYTMIPKEASPEKKERAYARAIEVLLDECKRIAI